MILSGFQRLIEIYIFNNLITPSIQGLFSLQ